MDQLMLFYLVLAIFFLGFVLLAIFGKTEENSNRKTKRTTTS